MKKETQNKERAVETVIAPPPVHMVGDGFRVHGFIPGVPLLNFQRMDPFLVLDYNSKFHFPPSDKPKGVGVHPHKGFETVTIAYKGSVAHNDSAGGGGIIHEGDVQWMTAANGVLHKEYHEENFSKKGGDFQMVQLWVNLPAKDKKSSPKYQAIASEKIAKHKLDNEMGTVDVIAGKYKGTDGPASTFSPIHLFNARLNKGGKAEFSFPTGYTTAMIVIEGSIIVNNKENAPLDHFVLMDNEGEDFIIEATENAVVFVLSGEPIQEPIAARGPFVMNTKEELIEAYDDFNNGKFGYLE